jgi:ribosome-associated protein
MAVDIVVLDITKSSDLADYFIICSGRSSTQVRNLFEMMEEYIEDLGEVLLRREGISEGKWIAVDYGTVIVHIFLEEIRQFYQLEKLWSNGGNLIRYPFD